VGAGGSAADGAADGAAEQPGSAATTQRDAAAMTDSFAGIQRRRPIP